MKNNFRIISTICIAVFLLVSCSKAKLDNGNADPNAKQHNEDIINTKSESDNSNTDINNALTGMTSFGKNCATQAISICGASIDSSHAHDVVPYIVIAFDGQTVCPNPSRIRGGQVKVELIAGTHWTDVGARLRVTYTNYKIQFPALNNHFLTFNGTKYLTDVNGINWLTIYLGTSTASIRERSYNMTVTFENGQISSWNDARLSTWGMSNQTNLYATVNGDTTIGGKTIDGIFLLSK